MDTLLFGTHVLSGHLKPGKETWAPFDHPVFPVLLLGSPGRQYARCGSGIKY